MRILFTPNGTYGDIHPYLGIAERLKSRGHDVIFLCNPYFTELIEECGYAMLPLRTKEELKEYWDHPDMWSRLNYYKISLDYCALRPMREMYHAIAEHYLEGETVVAGPAWSFGARIAQEKLHVPLATVHLEPFWIRSLHQTAVMPPPMVTGDWVGKRSKQLQFWIADEFFTDRFLTRPVNAFRGELGLAPAKRFLKTWWHSPQRVIGLFPDWFFPPQPDWPVQTRLTGFPIWDQSSVRAIPPEVVEFLDEGSPPVAFSPGSGNSQGEAFFEAAVEACRLTGRRGLLLTRYPETVPNKLPEGVRQFPYVPFSYLLPRASALVHHAGTGTAALCMRAGLPQVVMPMAYDQPDFAACLARLGVAKILKPKSFSGHALAQTLDEILSSAEVRESCRKASTFIRDADPIEEICDLLQETLSIENPQAENKPQRCDA